ncbi:MAG: outer membrane protein assembly factor BamA [Gammaproteobacteria bacterium]|nr:outer membrane protein assembly factor BamA [Gammaproteobacteria bacterium]MBP9729426.1 outer membrane protein assembly factor BamA [Gammaproteobacteria bacterium]
MKQRSILFLGLLGLLCLPTAQAFQTFTIKDIRVQGLQRVSKGAVLDNLPVHVGESFSESDTDSAIQALYKTGFFKDVNLAKEGDVLLIRVVERPSIRTLELVGIKDKEKIKKLLQELGLTEGRFYDPAIVLKAQKELERYYFSRGRYGVKIESVVTEYKKAASLMDVKFSIFEGDVARIKQIKIIGNTVFPEKSLLKEFRLQKTHWLSWFKQDDQYNKEVLAADLEILKSYYLDRGYLHFQVDSSQVALSPDKKHIFMTIQVTEGPLYHFGESTLEGDFVVPKEQLLPLLEPLKPGSTFSRKTLLEVRQALQDKMGDEGYSSSEAQPFDHTDETSKAVAIRFKLMPGKLMYVRRIFFKGNATTKDEVLRRELTQMEGTWIAPSLVREGKEKILRRGFGSQVDVESQPVPGVSDQVDLLYKMEEARLGQIGAGLGYSPSERLMFNFTLSQENFFGTGNTVDFTFDRGKAMTNYALGYQDPYFTVDGIGMGGSAYYNTSDMSKTSNVSSYTLDSLGGELRLLFPVGKYEALRVSAGYDDTHLKQDRFVAPEISNFINKYGTQFNEFTVGLGWNYDSLDQRIFPTRGMTHAAGLRMVIPGAKQQYYRLSYDVNSYYPILSSDTWIMSFSGNTAYGNGYGKTPTMPFYRNFTAGGSRFVRGFAENSLGPKDTLGRSFGGNVLVAASASLIFPNPIKPDAKSVRTALFLDAGQVYDTRYRERTVGNATLKRNPAGLRYSAGLSLTWHTPLAGAPLSFSLAKPLKRKPGDEVRYFTFWMGTQF